MSISINMEGDDFSFIGTLTLSQAGQIAAFIGNQKSTGFEITEQQYPDHQNLRPMVIPSVKSKAPREVIIEYGAKTNPEKIIALGKSLADEGDGYSFNISDVKAKLRLAGGSLPANMPRDIKVAVQNGWIFEIEDKADTYQLTDTGREAINSGFSTPSIQKPRRQSTKKSIGRIEIREEVMNLVFEDVSNYMKIEKKSDKVLWIINESRKLGIDGLIGKEISYIASEKLRDTIPNSSMTAFTDVSFKKGFIQRSDGGFKISQKGIAFIESI